MYSLKEKTYTHSSDKIFDLAIGTLVFALSVVPFIYINQIGNAIFPALLAGNSDGSTALGFGYLFTFSCIILPFAGGIITFLIARRRKIIFKGFLLGLPVLLLIWFTVSAL